MGWLDEYYKALDKKKKEEPKDSWMDSYHSELSKITAEQEKPSSKRVVGTTASDNTPLFLKEKKESIFDGWFKESEADSVSGAILGSGTDVLSDIGAGILGIGEKALDAFASLAPYAANAQFYQNGVFDLETEKAHKEAIEQSKKDIGEWVKKDLYNEEAVAKQLLSHLGASYDMTQKLQNGGIATEEDWKRYKQMQGDAAKYLDEDMEAHSVFDEKSDSLAQSAGQLAGTAALSAMGIPADVVIGLSSYGGEMENALKQGATYDEASFSSAVSAGAEILTEKISGGIKFGGKTLDDLGTKWLARNISNKALRTAANMGMQVIGEGAEEVASGFLSAVGQKLSYMDEKELSELFTKEDAWESFIGGAALGMGGSTIQTVNSAVNGVDSVTELTKNEQKVVDKVYKDELAKVEKNGKVTERQKAKIYDEVLEDMEKGYISTDTIEEVLGGERYEQYRKASEWEESLKQEFEELGKKENPTLADQRRFAELDKQLENVKATSTLEQMKAQLNKDVYEMTKGDRLVESYFENVRSKQKFEADLTKYEGKARDIIQKVMESGLADNSNQTHEFWDMAAQIATDRDTDISIANDEQILELVKKEYEAEGKTFDASKFKGKRIDGYASENGIVLNAQSKRALNFVLGHEITHTLEQSNHYKDLQKILFDYAKDEYRSRYNERAGQYKDIYTDEGYKAKMDKEVTADMVGDILFSDKDFVKHLSTENRNVFQKVWDEIKYFCKVATAGSKEARQLEKLKKTFEDVYREAGKAQGDGKYSVSQFTPTDIQTIQSIGRKSINNFNSQDIAATEKFAQRYWEEIGAKSPFYRAWFGDWRVNDHTPVSVATKKGDTRVDHVNKDTGWTIRNSGKVHNETTTHKSLKNREAVPYLPYIDEIIENAVLLDTESVGKPKSENSLLMHYLYAVADIGNGNEVLKLTVEEMYNPGIKGTNKRAYTLQNIEKAFAASGMVQGNSPSHGTNTANAVNTIADLFALVKQMDGNFAPNDASKIVNADGTPKVMYHGSPKQFTVFDRSKSKSSGHYGKGFYFTDSTSHAGTYGNLYSVYLNIRNPLQSGVATVSRDQVQSYLEAVAENEDYSIENYGTYNVDAILDIVMGKNASADAFKVINDINATAIGDMVEAAELFNSVNRTAFDGIIAPTETVAFYPEQIKSATDNIGTFDKSNPDIRFSLSDSDGKELTKGQQEYFKDSKMRDENGNLKVMYHGSQDAGFHTFDAKMSDDDTSFFFVDRNDVAASYSGTSETYEAKTIRTAEDMNNFLAEIGYDQYEAIEQDGKFVLLEDGEHIATKDTAQEIYEEFCWYEGVGEGDANYKVYLNLKNPLVVDAQGRNWNNISREFSQEVYDRYQTLSEEEKAALADLAEWGEYGIFKDEMLEAAKADGNEILFGAYEKLGGANANLYDAFTIASDNFSEDTLREFAVKQMNTRDYAQKAKAEGYDGVIFKNIHDNGGYSNGSEGASTVAIAFDSNQIKSVANETPTTDPDIRYSVSEADNQKGLDTKREVEYSISNEGQTHREYGRWNVYSKYIAPVAENATQQAETQLAEENATVAPDEVNAMFPDNLAPVQDEIERLEAQRNEIYGGLETALEHGSDTEVGELAAEYDAITARIRELEAEENQRTESLTDADVPAEAEAPMSMRSENHDPFRGVTIDEISRSTRSYSDLNPGARHFFEEAALGFLYDVNNSTHGERWYNDQLYYESGGEQGFGGTSRHTTDDIADLKDTYGYTWDELRTAAQKVADGDFRSVAAKRVEYLIHKRMMEGYTDVDGRRYEPNQDYISFLNETFANEQRAAGVDNLLANAPEDIAPVKPLAKATPDTMTAPLYDSKAKGAVKGQQSMFEPPKPNPKVATVLTEESAIAKEKSGIGMKLTSALVDKGMVFENLSLKTGNHELQAKWNYALPSNTEARAQYTMEHGASGVKSLKDIQKAVDKSGKADDFSNYLYHVHNIDRMTLEDRFDVENKTVFGETVTADVSRRKVAQYEKANPMFKDWAEDVYAYNRHLRQLLVEGNVISQDTADLWEKMYPHYVPIRRVDANGQNISVPLDTNKTGVHNPIKKATGGNSDIQPVFATMAQRTEQTYRAIARNAFGIELKNTLGSTLTSQKNSTGVDETIDTLVAPEDHLLKPGTQNSNPTFTVFEDGERVEFEITEDMFDALKPAGKLLGYRNKAVGKVSEVRRNMLTTWNPVFALYRNPIKDMQDVAVNSQHAVKTYLNVPNAIYQIATGGKYAQEYHQNGGKSNTYFDSRTNEFKSEDNIFKKTIGMPIRAIETAGEFIEEIPRLAEYIASRQEGRSVERSMLDAARVTTNFAAGGDFTKFLNSHGFTFLNASVQGASQHVRNIREAKQEGLKGYVKVLAKYTIAGLPTILLNGMLWDDDEEYEELSDYVKQNYYVVAKTEDGKFVRIPKGRTAAVMGELMNQMQNLVTGDDEADFATFYELFMNNIAPNNPVENNILAPIGQVMTNRAWYGDELVPSRLQKLPDVEQFDESTDSISKWLGEKTNSSPYKWNYLLDQYSGGLGDVVLPMLTPEAESGDNTFLGNMLAPWKKEITTDKVLNNKNPGNFYDLKDELEKLSNSSNATEEDSMRSMYMDSVSWEMGDLYAQKREIQSSNLSDSEKYEKVRELQEQINELAKTAMEGYNDVSIDGLYSEVGDRRYNKDAESGKWYEIREKNSDGSANYYYQKEQNVTKALGISYGEYWNNREEYDYAYDKPEQYALAQAVGGYDSYRSHTSELWDIKADKDENGKSINGSRKDKVIEYLNELDIDYYHKIILFKNEYNADDTYNEEIIEYLNGRDDISYQQMESILKYLGFDVDAEGNISWD